MPSKVKRDKQYADKIKKLGADMALLEETLAKYANNGQKEMSDAVSLIPGVR